MRSYVDERIIEALCQEVTKLIVEKYYLGSKLPETSDVQVERVMGELQPRGANDPGLDSKLDALEKGYQS